jgi:hypothetical protein
MQDRDVWGVVPDEALERKLSDVQQIALFRRWQQLGDPRWTTGPHPPSPPFSGDPQLRLVVEHLQHREARSER